MKKKRTLIALLHEIRKCELTVWIDGKATNIVGLDIVSLIKYDKDHKNFISTMQTSKGRG